MQSSLHQERLQRQEQTALCAELETNKQHMQHRCRDFEAKLKVQKNASTCVCMPSWCTLGKFMQAMCIQVAETRSVEAEEEQYRTEQELASARSELDILRSENQAAVPHTRTEELAHAESALLSVKADLDTATHCIHQLEQPASGQAPFLDRQQPAVSGQMYPDGLSRLSTAMKGRHSGLRSGAASDSSASSHEDTAQVMEVSSCCLLVS